MIPSASHNQLPAGFCAGFHFEGASADHLEAEASVESLRAVIVFPDFQEDAPSVLQPRVAECGIQERFADPLVLEIGVNIESTQLLIVAFGGVRRAELHVPDQAIFCFCHENDIFV